MTHGARRFSWRQVVCVSALALLSLQGCRAGFPSRAADYRFHSQLSSAKKDSYIRVLRDSVFSRVVSIQPESFAWRELSRFRRDFKEFDALDTARALVTTLRARQLGLIATRIAQALTSAKPRRSKDQDAGLEAGAIKQALVEATFQLAEE